MFETVFKNFNKYLLILIIQEAIDSIKINVILI